MSVGKRVRVLRRIGEHGLARACLAGAVTLGLSLAARAADPATTGVAPAVGASAIGASGAKTTNLSSKLHRATVTVESDKRRVTVHLVHKDKNHRPGSVQLTLFDKDDHPLTMELKATPATESVAPDDTSVVYSGMIPGLIKTSAGSAALSPSQQDYVGVQLVIPLSKGSVDTLRLHDEAEQ